MNQMTLMQYGLYAVAACMAAYLAMQVLASLRRVDNSTEEELANRPSELELIEQDPSRSHWVGTPRPARTRRRARAAVEPAGDSLAGDCPAGVAEKKAPPVDRFPQETGITYNVFHSRGPVEEIIAELDRIERKNYKYGFIMALGVIVSVGIGLVAYGMGIEGRFADEYVIALAVTAATGFIGSIWYCSSKREYTIHFKFMRDLLPVIAADCAPDGIKLACNIEGLSRDYKHSRQSLGFFSGKFLEVRSERWLAMNLKLVDGNRLKFNIESEETYKCKRKRKGRVRRRLKSMTHKISFCLRLNKRSFKGVDAPPQSLQQGIVPNGRLTYLGLDGNELRATVVVSGVTLEPQHVLRSLSALYALLVPLAPKERKKLVRAARAARTA